MGYHDPQGPHGNRAASGLPDYHAEAARLAAAGLGRKAAADRRVGAISLVILAAEAARIADEELAEAVRAASVCRLTVAELAAAAGKPPSWVLHLADG